MIMGFKYLLHVDGENVQSHHIGEIHVTLFQDSTDIIQHLIDLFLHVTLVKAMTIFITGSLSRQVKYRFGIAYFVAMDKPQGFLPCPGVDDFTVQLIDLFIVEKWNLYKYLLSEFELLPKWIRIFGSSLVATR